MTSEVRNGQTSTTASGYDGDGQLIGQILNGTFAEYLIRSSVLGTVLTKVNQTGAKWMTYVPANGLVTPIQNQNPGGTPFMNYIHRDPLGIQENGSAYDPFGNLVANVQPPSGGGPPGYTPTYGPPYGWGASSSTNGNNFATGCNAGGVSADCNKVMLGAMGLDFANALGLHLDNFTGEVNYDHALDVEFTRAAMRSKLYPDGLPGDHDPVVDLEFGLLSDMELPTLPGDPQKPVDPQTPCHIMADVAQDIANFAVAYAEHNFDLKKGIGSKRAAAKMALRDFDDRFSTTYHGGPLTSLIEAYRWRGGTGRTINPTFPYVGGAGFRSDFKDSGTESYGGPDADQTHHFSAYLSLGINGLWHAKKYHERGDNTGDQNLGRAAYHLGKQLRNGKFELKNIGHYIRTSICSGPGRGLR